MDSIAYVDLSAQWADERAELLPLIDQVLAGGQYVGGRQVQQFEEAAKEFFGCKYVVGLNSGTDSLIFALEAVGVGPGDEVITPPNSFIASTAAIVHIGARPVFVDVKPDQNIDESLIEPALSEKTKAIMPVHLTGRMAALEQISTIAENHGVPIIEDAAQSAGSCLVGRMAGTWGKAGCFSAHPLKNLNACGDAGFIVTNDEAIATQVQLMRNHGLTDRNNSKRFGLVSRMDSVQAAILKHRLGVLPKVIERRRANAAVYRDMLDDAYVYSPPDEDGQENSWHTFVIQVDRRDELQSYLMARGIETAVHYPVPIHLQPAARFLGYKLGDYPVTETQSERILTLPIHQYLNRTSIERIAASVNQFFVGA